MSPEEMNDVGNAIQSAWLTVQAQSGPTNQATQLMYVMGLVAGEKPYLWVTVEGIDRLISQVFEDQQVTDLVLMLQFHFFLRWGQAHEKFTALVDVLSYSCAGRSNEEKQALNAIPDEIKSRLGAREEIRDLLNENPWIVCLLLLRSYVSLVDPATLAKRNGIADTSVA